MNTMTSGRCSRSSLTAGLALAVPLLSLPFIGGPALAAGGVPAPPAPPTATGHATHQAHHATHRPTAPPADPPAEQARVPQQLPAAPARPPAAPPAGAGNGSGGGAGTGSGTGNGAGPVVDTTAGERVVICKYVRKPHVAEVPSHIIIVNEQALLGRGFDGTFPWPFSDAQDHSVAIRWAADGEQAREVSLSSCPTTPTDDTGGGGGTTGGSTGSSFGNDTVVVPQLTATLDFATRDAAPATTASPRSGELPQTGAPSGLEELLLLSSAALLAGLALRIRAATARRLAR